MNKSVYTRPKKPMTVTATRRDVSDIMAAPGATPALPAVHASSECHVTPFDVAERMAEYLGHRQHILEPSAGTGNLLMAAMADKKTAIERNMSLCRIIEHRTGIKPLCEDFLEYQPTAMFDGIIINPPFSKARQHIEKAFSCLETDGVMIALVPVTFKGERYRAETLEELPRDTFASCNVYTKIIYIEGGT